MRQHRHRKIAPMKNTIGQRLISFGDELPDLGVVPELIGDEPAVAEEFDVE